MDEQPKGTILSGYRILDLADEKGMFCARLLADMGAEVIRVEPPGTGPATSPEIGCLNAGKRRITLDLEKEAGRGLFRRLAAKADVVLETAAPGYLASLGLGYKELSQINPRLVMASITGFGQNGPCRDFKSHDLTLAALGGWLSVTGEPQAPLKPYGHQSYYTASLFAANGILLALWHRHATGKGQYMDISIMECVAAALDHVLVRYWHEGVVSQRRGSRHWNDAFRIFKCRDGYILLSLFQHWDTLVAWLESEGMAGDLTDEKWRDRGVRLQGAEHIAAVLERWTACHTVGELVEKGQLMRFPWAGVASVNDLLNNPQLAARDYFRDVECPSGDERRMPGTPVKMGRATWQTGSRVAAVGEDNAEIYHRELGLDAAEAEALAGEGVI
jgi:crotonobetainyl-CoA:carnitine CoA-transferase CaiB-like acyl-CoA transferase